MQLELAIRTVIASRCVRGLAHIVFLVKTDEMVRMPAKIAAMNLARFSNEIAVPWQEIIDHATRIRVRHLLIFL